MHVFRHASDRAQEARLFQVIPLGNPAGIAPRPSLIIIILVKGYLLAERCFKGQQEEIQFAGEND